MPSLQIELARLFEGDGDRVGALATLTAAVDRMPDEPATLVAQGKLLHRMGRAADGLERLRTALVLRPQDPELKRYVDRLAAGAREDSDSPTSWGRGSRRMRASCCRPRASRPATRRAAARWCCSIGASCAFTAMDCRGRSRSGWCTCCTERGAEENKEFGVHYTPGREEVDIRQARVYRRGARGEIDVLEATDRSDEDLSEPWYGLYYDNRAEIVRFEGLRAGRRAWRFNTWSTTSRSENQLADYFGDLQYIAENIPKRRWDYTLIAPASAAHPRQRAQAGAAAARGDGGGERARLPVQAQRRRRRSTPSRRCPGRAEVAPYLHVSTYAELGRRRRAGTGGWWRSQLAPDDELAPDGARPWSPRGMPDAETRARRLRLRGDEHALRGPRVRHPRLQALQGDQVLARRFGDCKDKASLMLALLREVGVERRAGAGAHAARRALDARAGVARHLRPRHRLRAQLDRYLDGTAEFPGGASCPREDQGVMALRVGRAGSALVETPVLPSSESRVERRWQVQRSSPAATAASTSS